MTRYVSEEIDKGLAILTLNRPDRRNAIGFELGNDLLQAVERAAADPAVRAVLLRGAGGTFSVGGDVKEMATRAYDGDTTENRIDKLRRLMEVSRLLHDMPKPTIAALNGACAGGALSLALACDLRVAAKSTKITTAFTKVGLPGDFGGIYLLTRLIGSARARELYFCAPLLTADEAHAYGIVTRVVADAELEGSALALARSLAEGPTMALRSMKQNLNLAENAPFDVNLDAEAQAMTRAMLTADHQEAARAFVEKRAPKFEGR